MRARRRRGAWRRDRMQSACTTVHVFRSRHIRGPWTGLPGAFLSDGGLQEAGYG